MTINTELKALQLRHPENGTTMMAAIVRNWHKNGRFVGYELQFTGERHTRHLQFDEIRRLQEGD